jgi:hypothetical protein
MANIYIKERKENIKRVVSAVTEAGGINKTRLIGKISIETGLSPGKIEEYIRTLIDAGILAISGDKVICVEQDEVGRS